MPNKSFGYTVYQFAKVYSRKMKKKRGNYLILQLLACFYIFQQLIDHGLGIFKVLCPAACELVKVLLDEYLVLLQHIDIINKYAPVNGGAKEYRSPDSD